MSAFCLLSMEHHLLEKVIIKLEWKSYFRLQQTCKQMDEMIWTNKNIKGIHADLHISYYNNMDYYSLRNSHDPDDCTYIYGVCWEKITIEMVEDDDFDFLEFFKSHRITCRQLIFEKRSDIEHPLEEFARMFKVLKPKAFRRGDYDTDFYPSFDVLFEAEGLEEVEIHVELVNAPKFYEIVTRLVSHFCRVILYVFPTDWTQENVSNLLSTMLQYIYSHPLPQFKSLEMHLSWTNNSGLSCTDYLHDLLRKYKINEEAVPNLNKTDYEITIGDYNYQEHYFVESSIAVLDLSAISMACQIDCRRMYFLGIVIGGTTNRITIQRM